MFHGGCPHHINQSIDLHCKSMAWLLYDRELRLSKNKSIQKGHIRC